MTAQQILQGAAGVAAVLAFAYLAWAYLQLRRVERARQRDVDERVAAIAGLPAPDELPRARDLTKADRRRMTVRTTPRAHKRRDGRWG